MVRIFFCILQKYWCKLYIMKSYNHIFIKICSSMKVSLCIYQLFMHSFHLQMMSILYFTYSTVCSPSVCHCVNHSVFQCLYNGFNINNYYIHYYKNVFTHKRYYDSNATSNPCSEYTNAHA